MNRTRERAIRFFSRWAIGPSGLFLIDDATIHGPARQPNLSENPAYPILWDRALMR